MGVTLTVLELDAECPLDVFEAPLREAGLALDVRRVHAGDRVPVQAQALIVLGGDMGAHDDHLHDWLPEVRDLIAATVEQAVPLLGLCLGAQLLAAATGGTVSRGTTVEVGAIDVTWTDAGHADRLLAGLPQPFVAGSWHRDQIESLPPGAAWLATSEQYPHQAFRVGERAWGVQFHPEVSEAGFARWATHPEPGVDIAAAATGFGQRHERVRDHGIALARSFAATVR